MPWNELTVVVVKVLKVCIFVLLRGMSLSHNFATALGSSFTSFLALNLSLFKTWQKHYTYQKACASYRRAPACMQRQFFGDLFSSRKSAKRHTPDRYWCRYWPCLAELSSSRFVVEDRRHWWLSSLTGGSHYKRATPRSFFWTSQHH